ncbi:hypothetical protein B5E52_16805 [Bacteroides xylanisolvens]|uniref:Uncharacterized protein n=1 Tax=Bacteroides xylanisolvens TaxID=371601 RepID=A0A1Y4V627_9BACE|nr:hypothetical protein B5E52_16805 [Bacteroides xylanisolvens]
MAKTSGGVRGNSPMRDRQRSVSDVMKTMQRLRNTYGAKNYERIKRRLTTLWIILLQIPVLIIRFYK